MAETRQQEREIRAHHALALTVLASTVVYFLVLASTDCGRWVGVAYAAGVVTGVWASRRIG